MKNKDYYVLVHSWMIKELNLSGNELLIYAVIYGFTQDNESEYRGGSKYMCEALNISERSFFNAIKNLISYNLIEKVIDRGNVNYKVKKEKEKKDNNEKENEKKNTAEIAVETEKSAVQTAKNALNTAESAVETAEFADSNNNINNNKKIDKENYNNAPENYNPQNEQNSIEEKIPNKPTSSEQKELSKLQKQREKNKEYYPIANKLKEYIEHVSRRKISDKTVDSYADTIRLLAKDLEVREDPKSDIEKVIEYLYTENQNNGIYAFVVESAVSLRQKFAKIEDKIKKKEIYKQNNSYSKNNKINYAEMEKYIL